MPFHGDLPQKGKAKMQETPLTYMSVSKNFFGLRFNLIPSTYKTVRHILHKFHPF